MPRFDDVLAELDRPDTSGLGDALAQLDAPETPLEEAARTERQALSHVPRFARPVVSGLRMAGGSIDSAIARYVGEPLGIDAPGTADETNRINNANAQVAMDESAKAMPFGADIAGTVSSTAQMLASPGGVPGKLLSAALTQANTAKTDANDAGLGDAAGTAYAAGSGLLEAAPGYLLDKMGLGTTEKVMEGKLKEILAGRFGEAPRSAMRQVVTKVLAPELIEENSTTLGQQGLSAITDVDPEAFNPDQLGQALRDTTVQTLMMTVMGHAPHHVIDMAHEGIDGVNAARYRRALERSTDITEASLGRASHATALDLMRPDRSTVNPGELVTVSPEQRAALDEIATPVEPSIPVAAPGMQTVTGSPAVEVTPALSTDAPPANGLADALAQIDAPEVPHGQADLQSPASVAPVVVPGITPEGMPEASAPSVASQPVAQDRVATSNDGATASVAPSANPSQPKPAKARSPIPEPAHGQGPDVLNLVFDLGGIASRPRGSKRTYGAGEHDAMPRLPGIYNRIMHTRGSQPGVMARMLREQHGIGDGTADTMWGLIGSAIDDRAVARQSPAITASGAPDSSYNNGRAQEPAADAPDGFIDDGVPFRMRQTDDRAHAVAPARVQAMLGSNATVQQQPGRLIITGRGGVAIEARTVRRVTGNDQASGSFDITDQNGHAIGVIELRGGVASPATLSHELVHAMRRFNLITQSEWVALVRKFATAEAKAQISSAYANAGTALSTEALHEECVAHGIETMPESVPPSIMRKLAEWFRRIAESLGVVRVDANRVAGEVQRGEPLNREPRQAGSGPAFAVGRGNDPGQQSMFGETFDHGKTGQDASGQQEMFGRGYTVRPDLAGESHKSALLRTQEEAIALARSDQPVEAGAALTGSVKQVIAQLHAAINQHLGKSFVNEDSGESIRVSSRGIGHAEGTARYSSEISALAVLGQIIRRARASIPEASTKEHVSQALKLFASVRVDGHTYLMKVTALTNRQDGEHRFYDLSSLEVAEGNKKPQPVETGPGREPIEGLPYPTSAGAGSNLPTSPAQGKRDAPGMLPEEQDPAIRNQQALFDKQAEALQGIVETVTQLRDEVAAMSEQRKLEPVGAQDEQWKADARKSMQKREMGQQGLFDQEAKGEQGQGSLFDVINDKPPESTITIEKGPERNTVRGSEVSDGQESGQGINDQRPDGIQRQPDPQELKERAAVQGENTPSRDQRLEALLLRGEPVRMMPGDSLSALMQGYTEARLPGFDMQGAAVHSPKDAAVLFAALRSPFVERVSWLITDKRGTVKASGIHSVGNINGSEGFGKGKVAGIIANHAERGDTLWVSHNHPSGDIGPSPGDFQVYKQAKDEAAQLGVRFHGIITNGRRFMSIPDPRGQPVAMEFPTRQGRPYEAIPYDDRHPGSAAKVEEAAALVRLIQTDPSAVVLMGVTSRLRMQGVSVFHPNASHQTLIEAVKSMGAERAFVATENAEYAQRLIREANNQPTAIQDIITQRGNHFESALRNGSFSPNLINSEVAGDQLAQSVMEGDRKFSIPLPGSKEWTLTDPDAEARFQQAHGIDKASLIDRAKEFAGLAYRQATRHFEHLDPKQDALAIETLRRFEAGLDAAPTIAWKRMLSWVDGMKASDMRMFERALILPDVVKDIEAGLYDDKLGSVPFFGRNDAEHRTKEAMLADIQKELDRINANGSDDLAKRVQARNEFQRGFTRQLIEAGLLNEATADDGRYYHRQVMEKMNAPKSAGLAGKGVRNQTRGAQKQRSGGGDFNTNYVESEFEYLSQMMQELAKVTALGQLKKDYDIRDQCRGEAKARNRDAMDQRWEAENTVPGTGEKDQEAIDQGWDYHWRSVIAMNMDKLARMIGNHDITTPFDGLNNRLSEQVDDGAKKLTIDSPDWFAALAWLADGKADVGGIRPSIHARAIFKAIGDREAHVKQTLGSTYATWQGVARESGDEYRIWQPEEGMQLVPGWTATDQAVTRALQQAGIPTDDLAEAGMPDVQIAGGMLKRSRVVVGPKPQWVIPTRLADQLEAMAVRRETNAAAYGFEKMSKQWKQVILLNPFRVLKYTLNNVIGDADIAMQYPAMLAESSAAAKDLWLWTHDKKMTPEASALMEEAMSSGLIGSGLSVSELPDISNQAAVRALVKGDEALWKRLTIGTAKLAVGKNDAVSRFQVWRESILRLSAARYFYRRIRAGEKVYGASKSAEITQLYAQIAERQRQGDTAEVKKLQTNIAAKLARELFIDYNNLSVGAQWARRFPVPFISWMAGNAPRYYRLIMNARLEGRGYGRAVAGAIGTTATKGAITAAVGIGAVAAASAAFSVLAYAFNEAQKKLWDVDDDEDPNKDVEKLFLIMGRYPDGTLETVKVNGALADTLGWFGMGNASGKVDEISEAYKKGETLAAAKRVAQDVMIAPVNKVIGGITPIIKAPAESMLGKTAYPDIRKPRAIRDQGQYWASVFGLRPVYDLATDRAGLGGALSGAVTTKINPGLQAYYGAKQLVSEWQAKNGVETPAGNPTERSNALFEAKAALNRGEHDRAVRWAGKWLDTFSDESGAISGDQVRKSLISSIRSSDPMHGTKKWGSQFMDGINDRDRKTIEKAQKYYADMFLGDSSNALLPVVNEAAMRRK